MKKIKSFIYLDEYKLYSISSQVFEGITEYIVHTHGENQAKDDEQKGPIGSGRIVADIFKEEKITQVKKNLYDYAYYLLEEELQNNNMVLAIDGGSIASIKNIGDKSFVKITGKVIFNDMKILSNILGNFNNLGEALGYLTMEKEYKNQINQLNLQVKAIKDRNQKSKVQQSTNNKLKEIYKNALNESGLTVEEEFLKQLKYIIDFGYQEQFEIKMPFSDEKERFLISAVLNRKYLKEDEFELITKYSRKTEKKFTIFGILTQNEQYFDDSEKDENDSETAITSMKEGVLNMIDKITNLEATLTGRLRYEYIIDPIAVYREI